MIFLISNTYEFGVIIKKKKKTEIFNSQTQVLLRILEQQNSI